jgi:hypothetical protein
MSADQIGQFPQEICAILNYLNSKNIDNVRDMDLGNYTKPIPSNLLTYFRNVTSIEFPQTVENAGLILLNDRKYSQIDIYADNIPTDISCQTVLLRKGTKYNNKNLHIKNTTITTLVLLDFDCDCVRIESNLIDLELYECNIINLSANVQDIIKLDNSYIYHKSDIICSVFEFKNVKLDYRTFKDITAKVRLDKCDISNATLHLHDVKCLAIWNCNILDDVYENMFNLISLKIYGGGYVNRGAISGLIGLKKLATNYDFAINELKELEDIDIKDNSDLNLCGFSKLRKIIIYGCNNITAEMFELNADKVEVVHICYCASILEADYSKLHLLYPTAKINIS